MGWWVGGWVGRHDGSVLSCFFLRTLPAAFPLSAVFPLCKYLIDSTGLGVVDIVVAHLSFPFSVIFSMDGSYCDTRVNTRNRFSNVT